MPSPPWQPSRATTVFLGVLSVWPIVYFFLFIAFAMFTFVSFSSGHAGGHTTERIFMVMFPLHLLTMLLIFALSVVYVIHAFRTDRIANDRRVVWVLVLIMGNMIAFPIYWYLYLWRRS